MTHRPYEKNSSRLISRAEFRDVGEDDYILCLWRTEFQEFEDMPVEVTWTVTATDCHGHQPLHHSPRKEDAERAMGVAREVMREGYQNFYAVQREVRAKMGPAA